MRNEPWVWPDVGDAGTSGAGAVQVGTDDGTTKNNNNNKTTKVQLRNCVKVEVEVLGSPSLTVPTVSVDVKQQVKKTCWVWTDHWSPFGMVSCVRWTYWKYHQTDRAAVSFLTPPPHPPPPHPSRIPPFPPPNPARKLPLPDQSLTPGSLRSISVSLRSIAALLHLITFTGASHIQYCAHLTRRLTLNERLWSALLGASPDDYGSMELFQQGSNRSLYGRGRRRGLL